MGVDAGGTVVYDSTDEVFIVPIPWAVRVSYPLFPIPRRAVWMLRRGEGAISPCPRASFIPEA